MAKSELSKLDQEFVSKAAEDGLVEIEMAKLAQKKAKSGPLREFAGTMLDDHTRVKKSLAQLTRKMGVKLPTKPSDKHQRLLEKVAGYEGDEFDRHFMSTVIAEHQRDVSLYHRESKHGGNDELKRFAAELAPVLEKHLDMAKSIQSHP